MTTINIPRIVFRKLRKNEPDKGTVIMIPHIEQGLFLLQNVQKRIFNRMKKKLEGLKDRASKIPVCTTNQYLPIGIVKRYPEM